MLSKLHIQQIADFFLPSAWDLLHIPFDGEKISQLV